MSYYLDQLLTAEQREDCARHDAAEITRVVRGKPYRWPLVDALRAKPAREKRSGPRSSRFADLENAT